MNDKSPFGNPSTLYTEEEIKTECGGMLKNVQIQPFPEWADMQNAKHTEWNEYQKLKLITNKFYNEHGMFLWLERNVDSGSAIYVLVRDLIGAKSFAARVFITQERNLMIKWKDVMRRVDNIAIEDEYILSKQLEELKSECEASGKNSDNIFCILLVVLLHSYREKFNTKITSMSWLYTDFCSTFDYDFMMKEINSFYAMDSQCELGNMYIDILKERFSK